MSKKINVLFNYKLADFVNYMIDLFPNEEGFQSFKNSCETIVNIDYRLPMQSFKLFVSEPYGDRIKERNEEFFLNNNSYEDNACIDPSYYGNVVNIIDNIKTYWREIPSNIKEEIWGYLQLFNRLSNE